MIETKLPATREEAIEAGSIFFFTGQPCKNGHIAKRYTTSGQCTQCLRTALQTKMDRIRNARARKQPTPIHG